MDLRNSLEHAKRSKFNVNGHIYSTDAFGIMRNVALEDAKKLLSNAHGVWTEVVERASVRRTPVVDPVDPVDPDPENQDPVDPEVPRPRKTRRAKAGG